MHVAILGAGSLGTLFAAKLAAAGACAVTLIGRPQHVEVLRVGGITVTEPDGSSTVVPPDAFRVVSSLVETDRATDVLVVTPKAAALEAALREAVNTPVAAALPVENGIDHLELLDAAFGPGVVLGGATLEGAELLRPGHVRRLVAACTFVGERDGRRSDRVDELCDVFTAADLRTQSTPRIEAAMWTKLVHSCASTGTCGATRLGYTSATRTRAGAELSLTLVREGLAVLDAMGIAPEERFLSWVDLTGVAALDDEAAIAHVQSTAAALAAQGYTGGTSLMRDLDAGRTTEVEHILGALVRRADAAGVPVPTMRAVYLSIAAADQAS